MSNNQKHPNAPGQPGQPGPPTNQGDEPEIFVSWNENAERSLLGAIMLDNRNAYAIGAKLPVEAFWNETHRILYREFIEMSRNDIAIDVISVADRLAQKGDKNNSTLDRIGGTSTLTALSNAVASAANVGTYLDIVLRHWRIRKMDGLSSRIRTLVRGQEPDPDDISAEVLDTLRDERGKRESRKTSEQIDETFGDRLTGSGEDIAVFPTGINDLDRILAGGIAPGRIYYIAAITKMGKTTLGIAIAAQLMRRHGFAVDFWSVEQSHEDLEARFVAWSKGVDFMEVWEALRKLRDKNVDDPYDHLDDETRIKIEEGRREFRQWDLEIDMQGSPHVRDIELETRARLTKLPPERRNRYAVFVDYVQNCHAGNRRSDRYGDLADAARRLNGISKDLGVPVFVMAQFDKEAEKRWAHHGKRPRFSDLRGLSQAGNDSNHFLIVHRDYRDSDDRRSQEFTEIYQDLSRHGYTGASIELKQQLEYCRFSSWYGDAPRHTTKPKGDQGTDWKTKAYA